MSETLYDKDALLAALRKRAKELGRTPRVKVRSDMAGLAHPMTYVYHFGSWTNACGAAGLKLNRPGGGKGAHHPNYNKALREIVWKRHAEGLETLTQIANDLGISRSRVGQVARELDIPPTHTKDVRRMSGRVGKWENRELLDALKQRAAELGRTPRSTAGNDDMIGLPTPTTYVERFGNWSNACRLAGLKPNPRGQPSRKTKI
jgi:hypothetical protein